MSNKTFKVFVDKMGGNPANTFIGRSGDIFYDPETTSLRISDGQTPGGIEISGGGGSITGNIVVSDTNSEINFVANSSGDGEGYSTIEIIPDTNAPQDQYLIIDPTAPSHIHIRAGGEQDNSSAELYLGGEKNFVKVVDNDGVTVQNERTFDDYFYYSETTHFVDGVWYEQNGSYYVVFITNDATMQQNARDFIEDDRNQLNIAYGETSETLTQGGYFNNPTGNTFIVEVNEAPPGNTEITAIEFRIFTTDTSEIQLRNGDFTVEVTDDIRMYSKDEFILYNYSTEEGIQIRTDYDDFEHRWEFKADGQLLFPKNGLLNVANSPPSSSIGAGGDKRGTLSFDGSYMYYCVADYDGEADIWRRIEWSANTSW